MLEIMTVEKRERAIILDQIFLRRLVGYGFLQILPKMFREVCIPDVVYRELVRNPKNLEASRAVKQMADRFVVLKTDNDSSAEYQNKQKATEHAIMTLIDINPWACLLVEDPARVRHISDYYSIFRHAKCDVRRLLRDAFYQGILSFDEYSEVIDKMEQEGEDVSYDRNLWKKAETDLLIALMLRGWQIRNTGPCGRYSEKAKGSYWFRVFELGDSRYRLLVYDTRTYRMVLDRKLKLRAGMEKKYADKLESVVRKMSEKGG